MSDTGSARFFAALDELVQASEIVIDRPKDTPHPRIPTAIYPVDYGYLAGTRSNDGAGIDAFVGSSPDLGLVGVVLTADVMKRDAEIKVLLACAPAELDQIRFFLVETLGIGGCVVLRC